MRHRHSEKLRFIGQWLKNPRQTAAVAPSSPELAAAMLGELPAYATVNLALGSEWERFNLELFVQNLFDERGQVSRFMQCGNCYQRPYIVPINPRTIGLRAGAKF